MRILVLGGTGFIGGHVARAMAAARHDVTVLGRRVEAAPAGTRPVAADRGAAASMTHALRGERFDATCDFSGYDSGDIERVLEVPGFVPGRYVFASTGQVCLVGTGRTMPFVEADGDSPLSPEPDAGTRDHGQWSYGTGKRRAEAAIAGYSAKRGLEALVLRLPVIWGDGDASLRTWGWLQRILDGGPILVADGGTQGVRFLWVEDLAPAIVRAFERWPLASPVYHVAQADIVPFRIVLETLAAACGRSPEYVDVPLETLVAEGLSPGPQGMSFIGRWVSVLDPGLAVRDWGFQGTPFAGYATRVARAHLDHPPGESHEGYAHRAREIELARRLKSAAR